MRRRKGNPTVGFAEDLFAPVGALTPVVRDLSELTEEEIVALPRSAFSDKEWDQLDEDMQAQIVEGDSESQARIAKMIKAFVDRHKWTTEFQDHMRDSIQEDIDYYIGQIDGSDIQRYRQKYTEVSNIFDNFGTQGYSEEQIEGAVLEALQDNNNYDYSWDTDEYGSAFFKGQSRDSFYIDRDELDELMEGMYENEIEAAIEEINAETHLSLKRKDFKGKYEFTIEDYSTFYGDADPDWDKIEETVKELLGDKEPEGEGEEEVSTDPEERILYRFKDGFYVINLLVSELAAEGKAMGMCVGRADMGYTKAVRAGQTQIWSLRRPSGKPLFTFEVRKQGSDFSPTGIVQIKGKANRLPGWDLGQEGRGTFKEDEVKKVIEFIRAEGGHYTPDDLEEIRDLKPALQHMKGLPAHTNPTSDKVHCGFCCPVDR